MKWIKKGLIYCPNGEQPWAKHTALTPTPLLLNSDTIRVYAGFRDADGVSRIGYVDVSADNPAIIKDISKHPVLDVGLPGTFDDNGIILGDVLHFSNTIRMYYVGFQLVQQVKFLAFTGLAISQDGGYTFKRYSNCPILDRCDNALYIRAAHSITYEDGVWRAWCGVGSGWQYIDEKPFPQYNIRFYESKDGIQFSNQETVCINPEREEYRIGRPRVIKEDGIYKMFYTYGTLNKDYLPGYAESEDGVVWIRKDHEIGVDLSPHGWDSKTLCYPSLISVGATTYMFYNGNDMGKTGFGYAVLER